MIAYVGLGANLGDAVATLNAALGALAALPSTQLLLRSSFYATAPVDATGPTFTNAVASMSTILAPIELLRHLQSIENDHGRQRPYRNAPRTLDLDLLMMGDVTMRTAELTLPHPRLHQRAFVLVPLLEIAPGCIVPGLGRASDLLISVADQGIHRLTT
ncbi:2-amino-4-hydroxy-6-hydroxymethyldihydropteridinediphosphokinase [soil metagenome]